MGKKNKAPKAQKTKTPPIDWREKLSELDINLMYANRTCDILMLLESTEIFYEVVTKFAFGSKFRPEAAYKIIRNIDIINDIRYPEEPIGSPNELTNVLYAMAREEGATYVDRYAHIPLELLCKLIKLKIITVINADIHLLDPPVDPPKSDKNRKRSSALKTDGKTDPRKNDKSRKHSSILKTGGKAPSTLNTSATLASEGSIKESRHLYILLAGFYEFEVMEYLFKIGIVLSAIMEITGTEDDYVSQDEVRIPEKASDEEIPLGRRSTIETPERKLTVDEGCQVPFIFSSFTSDLVPLYISTQPEMEVEGLDVFWDQLHAMLDGTRQTAYLANTAHMIIPRVFEINLEVLDDYQEQSIKTFDEIGVEIQKIAHMQKAHKEYIDSLSINNVDHKQKRKFADQFKIYKFLSDTTPPECLSIELIMSYLVEEACARVVKKGRQVKVVISSNTSIITPSATQLLSRGVKKVPSRSALSTARTKKLRKEIPRKRFGRQIKPKRLLKLGMWIKSCIYNVSPYHLPTISSYKCLLPKTRLKMKERSFSIHANDTLYHKAYCYPQISKKLINRQLDLLKYCRPTRILNCYKRMSFANSLFRKNQVQEWARALDKTEEEMLYLINMVAFESVSCKLQKVTLPSDKSLLQLSFPGKSYHREENTVITQIKYILAPAKTPITPPVGLLPLPILRHSINTNIYETRNTRAYKWFENLEKPEFLQSISKARKSYLCLDHLYCPFNDTLLLRYHNQTDLFGINMKVWKKHICTPVGFKDFCKYVFQNDYYRRGFGSVAYDVTKNRLQLQGTTTVFHSIDGCKVTAEQANFIGEIPNLTISISTDLNYLVLHCRRTSTSNLFNFHISLADGIIIALKKISRYSKPGLKVGERGGRKDPPPLRKKQITYQVTESICRLTRFEKPIVVRKPRALTKTELRKFTKECTCWYDDPISCKICKTLFNTSNPIEIQRKERIEVLAEKYSEELDDLEICRLKREKLQQRSATLPMEPPDFELDDDQYCKKAIRKSKPRKYPSISFRFNRTIVTLKEAIEKIELAKKDQIPHYKVCSSRLHKYTYLVPCKSIIKVKFDKKLYRIPCCHPRNKIKNEVKVIKLEPIRLTYYSTEVCHWYDMSLSLPSGLLLHTIPSLDEGPFNVRQEYIDKGPICKPIFEERTRTFMRDGKIVIKKMDGTIAIMGNGGINMFCDLPYHSTSFHAKHKIKKALKKCTHNYEEYELTKRQKLIKYIIQTRTRHVINSNASRHFNKSRLQMRINRIQNNRDSKNGDQQVPNPLYYTEESQRQFTYLNRDVRLTLLDNTCEKKIEYRHFYYKDYYEIHYVKPDGVKCILHSEGTLISEFPDKTKITTTFDTLRIAEYEDDDYCWFGGCWYYDDLDDEPPKKDVWILIQMTYKFEHPNYLTVYYDNINFEANITLPNDTEITISERGEYTISVKEDYMKVHVNRDSIKYYSTKCKNCKQNFNALINITPLYYEFDYSTREYEVLRAYDTYDKMFSIFADGKCFKNSNFIKTRGNKFRCLRHDKIEHQQLFVLRRNLTGYRLWDARSIRTLLDAAKGNPSVNVTESKDAALFHSTESYNYKYLKFETRISASNATMFTPAMINPQAFRVKHHWAVIEVNFIHKPPEMSHFYESIHSACGIEDTCPFDETNSQEYLENLIDQCNRARGIETKPEEITLETRIDAIKNALSMCRKWYVWHKKNDDNCTCKVHKMANFPPTDCSCSDFTFFSKNVSDSLTFNSGDRFTSSYESLLRNNCSDDSIFDKEGDVSESKLVKEKWKFLENLSNSSDDDLIGFLGHAGIKPTIPEADTNVPQIETRDSYSSSSKRVTSDPKPLWETLDDSDTVIIGDADDEESLITPAQHFQTGLEENVKLLAEAKKLLMKNLVAICKATPPKVVKVKLYDRSTDLPISNSSLMLQGYDSTMIFKCPKSETELPRKEEKPKKSKVQQMKYAPFARSPDCKLRGDPTICALAQPCKKKCQLSDNLAYFVASGKPYTTLNRNKKYCCADSTKMKSKFTSINSLLTSDIQRNIGTSTPNPKINRSIRTSTSDIRQGSQPSFYNPSYSSSNSFYNASIPSATISVKSRKIAPKPKRKKSKNKKKKSLPIL